MEDVVGVAVLLPSCEHEAASFVMTGMTWPSQIPTPSDARGPAVVLSGFEHRQWSGARWYHLQTVGMESKLQGAGH